GVWSDAVDVAEATLLTISDRIASQLGSFEERSERAIRTLHPAAQRAAREFVNAVRAAGADCRVISGTRSYAEQDALYRRGRFGNTSPRVTNARGGQSNHNFGIAWDIGLFDGGRYLTDDPPYARVSTLRPAAVDWGGDWKTFRDPPHYQLRLPLTVGQIREQFETGTLVVDG
ncbi:MAG TPA: M15 family metallopeptidase, partial [Vicinamibacterales bacterium]|nr:M15 family metallopeptidase [Vicinamibacterales bacterium]